MPADEKDWHPVTVQARVAAILFRIKAAQPHACARQILSRTGRHGRYDETRELLTPARYRMLATDRGYRGINDKQ